jgi:hypothetical protein
MKYGGNYLPLSARYEQTAAMQDNQRTVVKTLEKC